MRKAGCIVVAICLLAPAALAQSRHRGYQAAGGWHRKVATSGQPPARQNKKKNNKRPAPSAPAPQTDR
jgi:hypothetical protein